MEGSQLGHGDGKSERPDIAAIVPETALWLLFMQETVTK
jgi:hypothetical protein